MKKYTWLIISSLLFILLCVSVYWNQLQSRAIEAMQNKIAVAEAQLNKLKEENIILRSKRIQPTPEIPGVVFTFDDGPFRFYNNGNPINNTEIILDILKSEGIKAAFFVLGEQYDKKVSGGGESTELYKSWLKRTSQEGHTIAVHSYSHIAYLKQSKKKMEQSINLTIKRIKELTGAEPSDYCRSPYGWISTEVEKYLGQRGLKHVYWHIAAEPLNMKTTDQFITHLKSEIDNGMRGIILMHDRHASTYLPELIKYLKEKKIRIMPLEEWDAKYGLPQTPHQKQVGAWK